MDACRAQRVLSKGTAAARGGFISVQILAAQPAAAPALIVGVEPGQ